MGLKEVGANLLAEAKRLPWWAWLLILAGLYLGYKLITADQSGQNASDPLAGVLDTTGPAGPSSGDTSNTSDLPTLNSDLANLSGSNDNQDFQLNNDTVTPARVIQQGRDTHDAAIARQKALDAANAAQAARSRQQAADLRQYHAEQNAKTTQANAAQASRSRQQGRDIRTYHNEQLTAMQRRQQIHSGTGGGPDAHYTVRKGDDIYTIASRYNVSPDDVYAANRDKIDASVREAGLAGFGVYALPAIGEGLDLVIPGALL